jgi:hypothetical protein
MGFRVDQVMKPQIRPLNGEFPNLCKTRMTLIPAPGAHKALPLAVKVASWVVADQILGTTAGADDGRVEVGVRHAELFACLAAHNRHGSRPPQEKQSNQRRIGLYGDSGGQARFIFGRHIVA